MLRPPVKWHGGKFYLAQRIVSLFPPHHTYVEPFGGAASVLLNKLPSPVEVYNDIDERIIRLFRVLRDHPDEFLRKLVLTPYSEREWQYCNQPTEDEIEQARRDFVRWRESIGGRGQAFSYTLHRVRRGMADVVSGFLSAIDDQLPAIVERLRLVQITCRDALWVIRTWDSPETLFYCDPPYYPDSVACREVYKHNMSPEEHKRLLDLLCTCQGKVIVSGYPNELYDRVLRHWRRLVFDMPNHAAGGRKKKRCSEVLWLNW